MDKKELRKELKNVIRDIKNIIKNIDRELSVEKIKSTLEVMVEEYEYILK